MNNINHKRLLSLLRSNEAMAKPELGQTLGLSHTTINSYISQLTDEGLVVSNGVGKSAGGRRPGMVRIFENARLFIGICFAPGKIHIPLVNLLGSEIKRYSLSYSPADSFEFVLQRVAELISEITRQENIAGRISGVGMVFPGVVNSDELLIKYAPNINIRNFSLRQFEEKLHLRLYIENEAIAAAKAERFLFPESAHDNCVYVSIAEGIGTGILINGSIYKGSSQNAGEFGHNIISDNGLKCKCGRHDCWELYASSTALVNYYRRFAIAPDDDSLALNALQIDYKKNLPPAVKAVEEFTRYLFRGLETIMVSLNPDEVVIGGDLGTFIRDIIDYGLNELKLNRNFRGYENISVRASRFDENGAVRGSALLPLYEYFE